MRLLKLDERGELRLTEDLVDGIPLYAILSHTWGADKDEVTFDDIRMGAGKSKAGYGKIQFCGEQARRDNFEYFWVDTCCIDKQSSAELSEAINSMYGWYKGAKHCYVYLQDAEKEKGMDSFRGSKWFTRGWTLQELIAPPLVSFYDCKWRCFGDRTSLSADISQVTGISYEALMTGDIRKYSIARKMSWAARRLTTRIEDSAYCLMGLFDVNMPLIYGERERAFKRLQQELIRETDDQSIFAWSMNTKKVSGLLAPAPSHFAECGEIIARRTLGGRQPFSMTNRGLSVNLKITPWSADTYQAYLECSTQAISSESPHNYARIDLDGEDLLLVEEQLSEESDRPILEKHLFVRSDVDMEEEKYCLADRVYGYRIPDAWLVRSSTISTTHRFLDERVAILEFGGWGQVIELDVSAERQGLKRITLGFDFDFHPVCLLEDSSSDGKVGVEQKNYFDWSNTSPSSFDWYQVHEGSRAYRRNDHDGVWAVRGHRLHGLDVLLSAPHSHNCTLISLQRNEKAIPMVWEFRIDDLAGPFAGYTQKQIANGWGDRRNFQSSFGLKMTPEDLKEGDSIVEALYDPWSSFRKR